MTYLKSWNIPDVNFLDWNFPGGINQVVLLVEIFRVGVS